MTWPFRLATISGRTLPIASSRHIKKLAKRVITLAALMATGLVFALKGNWLVPVVLVFYLVCGLLDVMRNTRRDWFTWDSYFFGNGVCTWLLAPFNLFMDLLTMSYWNQGIYQLEELPQPIQDELNEVIEAAHQNDVIGKLKDKVSAGRSMIFFKWYGKNLDNSVTIPAFHQPYKYVRTIGVSVFNRRKSTSWHFGPLRATLRVLYNLRPATDDAAFIQVGQHAHRWNEGPLFIFDDTLMHQSCNETDTARYCMFIDIVRPSRFPKLVGTIVTGLQYLLVRSRFMFYRRWAEIR